MAMVMNPLQSGPYPVAPVAPLAAVPGPYGVVPVVDGQVLPQGIFGSILGGLGGGLAGGALGGLFGNRQLGTTIGNAAGGILGGFLPFSVDPMAAAYGYGGGQNAPQAILVPQNTLDPETQAFNDFMQGVTSGLIAKLHDYLSQQIGQHPQLADSIPLVTRATEFFDQRDYGRAFAQLYQAFRAIALVRAKVPELPALGL